MRLHLLIAFVLLWIGGPSVNTSGKILIDQDLTVVPGDFKEVHFLIPENISEESRIEGSFMCMGGFNDDITLYALSQPDYVRWLNHYKYHSEVKMEKKKNGHFHFEVKPGETYYFVLDNFFSSVSKKTVHLKLELLPASSDT